MSHINFKEVATSSAAYALRDAFDEGVLSEMFSGVSSSSPDHVLGADNATGLGAGIYDGTGSADLDVSDPLDLMARMARLLDDENVPEEGRYFVAPPNFYEQLSQSGSKLLSVDFNAGQGSIRNGLVSSGKLRGFSMYKSNNVPAVSTITSGGQVLAGHMSAVATAQTITSTEVIRDPDSFGDIVRGLHVYGAKVLRPKALAIRSTVIVTREALRSLPFFIGEIMKYGNKKKRMGYMKGGMKKRMMYNKGGYASIGDMEKKCSSMAGMNTMKMEGEK
jgi:hypothetical protein